MSKRFKRVIKIVLLDILAYIVAMGTFLAIFYLVPYDLKADGDVVGNTDEMVEFDVPGIQFEGGVDSIINSDVSGTGNKYNGNSGEKWDHIGTELIEGDKSAVSEMTDTETAVTELDEYSTDNVHISLSKKEVGSGKDKVTYYVAHVYVSSLEYFRTALAKDKYGTNIKDDVDDIAEDNGAIFAVTGDSYGNNSTGIVVRDGILYRDDENDADVCLLYTDGTMKTVTAEKFDEESVKENNVWQAWCFGPALLDGNGEVLPVFTTSSYLNKEHPRVSLGYVAPGHYVFAVVDGRNEGYSRGVTISELAVIMQNEGCVSAFNLDGGGSATMYFDGEYVNESTGREISDIIYIPME